MLRQPIAKSEPKPPPKYPGIVAAARELKVDRTHLWRCLTSERSSPKLLQRFAELPKQQHPQNSAGGDSV